MDSFVEDVARTFELGDADDLDVTQMRGSANRLWRFSGRETMVVKEFAHDSPDDISRRREAAAFEQRIFQEGDVLMPEPVRSSTGELICMLSGSRGRRLPVRMHRWMDGTKGRTLDREYHQNAGSSLFAIQVAGRKWSSEARGSLSWWDEDPRSVLDRLQTAARLTHLEAEARPVLSDALHIVREGECLDGDWIFTHCDHKPENSLRVGERPAVLDWDECGHCHPRLEAVEAALRWAGETTPDKGGFLAFLEGYSASGGSVANLKEGDFAKWVAALVGWFCFQARRALGDYPEDRPPERTEAAMMARQALDSLVSTMGRLSSWVRWL